MITLANIVLSILLSSSTSLIFTLVNTGHQSDPNKLYISSIYFISLFNREFNQSTLYFNSFIFFSFDWDACQIPMSFPATVLFYYPTTEITTILNNIYCYILLVLLFTITYSTHQTVKVFYSYKLISLPICYILYKVSRPYTRVIPATHNQMYYITATLSDYNLRIT